MTHSILFFDIDGTILTEDGTRTVPESTKKALTLAKEQGHLLFINTGRVYLNVEPMIRELGFDGFVCGCGTHIIYHGEELFHHEISEELCKKTVDIVKRCKMNVIYEAMDMNALEAEEGPNTALAELIEYFSSDGRRLVSTADPQFHFDKFTGWYRQGERELHERFRAYIADEYDYIDRGSSDGYGMCEIVPKGYSKGTGIRFLLDYFGIGLENCYAFGDSTNDLPMFEAVIHSVAMGGSAAIVMEAVEYVTHRIAEDGLYHAMEHYGLLGTL